MTISMMMGFRFSCSSLANYLLGQTHDHMVKRLRDGSMNAQGKAGTPLTAVTIGLTVDIFTLDVLMQFGSVSSILYLIPLLLTLRMPHRAAPLVLAGSCTALIALGFIYFPSSLPEKIALLNRSLGLLVMVIWCVAMFMMKYKEAQETLRENKTQLQAILSSRLLQYSATVKSDGHDVRTRVQPGRRREVAPPRNEVVWLS
jgi:hypothetical protein